MPPNRLGDEYDSTISFTVATYNVHRWVGSDGHFDPARVLRIVGELDADILCLQEVAFATKERVHSEATAAMVERFAAARGMEAIRGPTLLKRNGYFGNLLMTAYPSLSVQRIDLSVIDCEPRGAIDANLDIRGLRVRLIATHLGLRAFERKIQVKRLLSSISNGDSNITIVTGDFNEWFPASKVLQEFRARFGYTPALRTFPSRFPLLALDRIWVQPAAAMKEIQVYNTPPARISSDHLPLKARIVLP